MCAASQIAFGELYLGEHAGRDLDMHRLARVRRHGKRYLILGKAKCVRGTACDKRYRLKGLARRTKIGNGRRVAERQEGLAAAADNDQMAAMNGLDRLAACNLSQDVR